MHPLLNHTNLQVEICTRWMQILMSSITSLEPTKPKQQNVTKQKCGLVE